MELDSKHEIETDRIDAVRNRFSIEIPGICRNCQSSHILRTGRSMEPELYCRKFESNKRMPLDIVECNKFEQIGVLSVWELAKLALDIDLTPERKTGFRHDAGAV